MGGGEGHGGSSSVSQLAQHPGAERRGAETQSFWPRNLTSLACGEDPLPLQNKRTCGALHTVSSKHARRERRGDSKTQRGKSSLERAISS